MFLLVISDTLVFFPWLGGITGDFYSLPWKPTRSAPQKMGISPKMVDPQIILFFFANGKTHGLLAIFLGTAPYLFDIILVTSHINYHYFLLL